MSPSSQPGQPWALAGSAPVPDPTKLTTDAVEKLERQLKEIFDNKLAAAVLVTDERFKSIDQQLTSVERQRVEQKADVKAAVDAALQAQKEAVREQTTASEAAIAKSEAATSKQLDQLQLTFTTALAGVTTGLNDLKERIATTEAKGVGATEQRYEQRSISAGVIAAVGIGVTVILAVLTVVTFIITSSGSG
jgi:hypothetical protein